MTIRERTLTSEAYSDVTCTIPSGSVMNYEGVSDLTGVGIARSVGTHLAQLPEDTDVPWWRVVGKQGKHGFLRTSGDCAIEQRERLEAEGIVFDDADRFIFEDYRYRPPTPRLALAT